MKPSTPAAQINARDLDKNTEALRTLLRFIHTAPQIVVDCRYGLGGWAKVLHETFPQAHLVGFEADLETFERAWVGDRSDLHCSSSGTPSLGLGYKRCDLLLADFNTVTKLKREELDEEIERWQPEWLIFTDVACGKLHLNFKSYCLAEPDLGKYWRSWDIPGYEFKRAAKHHHAASTALFRRTV